MNDTVTSGGRPGRPPVLLRDLMEFIIVAGASLLTIFIVIPSQTSSGDEIGLAPGFVPTVCAAAIGILAGVQFLLSLFRRRIAAETPAPPVTYAALLIGSTLIGVLCIRFLGWEAGGAIMALLVSLVMGERRKVRLATVSLCVAAALFAIGKLGI